MNDAATPARTLPPPATDFPWWLPAMLVKELRQGLRARGFVGLFVVFHLVAVIVFWWTIELNSASGLRDTFNWLNGVFWTLLNVVLLLVVPLRGLGGLRMEIDNKTLDLLVLTRLTGWRIVFGKWVALVAQAALFLIALLPYGVVRYFFGSVDLTGDLLLIGALFVVSAALAAIGLWVSGLPKVFRVIIPLFLFLAVPSSGLMTIMGSLFSGRPSYGGGWAAPLAGLGWSALIVPVLVILVFLALAVRRIAPRAENHAMTARIFGLGLLVATIVTGLVIPRFSLGRTLGFAFFIVLAVSAIELSRDCLPMESHWRRWRDRGGWGRWVGRLMLPGWPSAALFAAVALALVAVPAFFSTTWLRGGTSGFTSTWWLMLAWQALVFPALVLSFLPPSSSMRIGGTGYFVVQGLFGTISLLSVTNSAGFLAGENFARTLDAICQLLPVFSFWLGGNRLDSGFTVANVLGQSVALGVLVALVWRQSRLYWGTVARYERRAATPPSAP